ncbi:MAG: hypothetical protein AAFQ82_22570, partial [Myxococcota bacterium]
MDQASASVGPSVTLSEKTLEVVGAIEKVELRGQIDSTLRFAMQALNDLGRIHLPQDQFEEREQ